jgi:hypothetical protein
MAETASTILNERMELPLPASAACEILLARKAGFQHESEGGSG